MSTTITVNCGKPGCQVALTGSCAEGHTPKEACPWYGKSADDIQTELPDAPLDGAASSSHDFIELPSGAPMTAQELDTFLRARPIRMISIIGDRDSGKTTLICSIYDMILKGNFTDWLFCGSHTLVGFEQRSHESRVASRRSTPDTAHTSLAEGLQFFHLSVCKKENCTSRTELMLSDRAGESFAAVRDNPKKSIELIEVVKADKVAILLDGNRLADVESRGNAFSGVRQLIRALLNGGAITKNSDVQILLTKKDIVAKAVDGAALGRQIDEFFRNLTRDFAKELKQLTFWEVAARDPSGATSSGLIPLMSDWLQLRAVEVPRTAISGNRHSEFDRLLDRVGLEYLP